MATALTRPHLPQPRCSVCAEAITIHERVRGGTCARTSCRTKATLGKLAQLRAAEQAALGARIEAVRASIVPTLQIRNPESVAFAIVPASMRSVAPLPKRRRNAFRRHLSALVADALSEPGDRTAAASPGDTQAAPRFDPEAPALQAACATCRGHCCRLGAPRNAFLDVVTLQRVMAMRPELRPRQVVGEYVRRIPRESVEDSCVFHGASGCTLPRPMRASICNNYHCDGLQRLELLRDKSPGERILIVASPEKDAARWSLFDPGA